MTTDSDSVALPSSSPAPAPSDSARGEDGAISKERAISASILSVAGYAAGQVLRLGGNIAMAYFLFPAAFGLMGIVTVFLLGLQLISDTGINQNIIQSDRGDDRDFLDTAWTVQVFRGIILWLASCAIAWPVAVIYEDDSYLALLPVAGLTCVLSGFGSTRLHVLNRRVELGKLTAIEIAVQVIDLAVKIVWALVYPTVWCLLGGTLVGALAKTILSHTVIEGAPNRFRWERSAVRSILSFGKWILASTLVGFIVTSSDKLILGKLLPLAVFGLYHIASTYSRLVVNVVGGLIQSVIFPVLASHRTSTERLMEVSLRIRPPFLWLGGSFCAAQFIAAPVLFDLCYDPRYEEAGWMASWLVVISWATILLGSVNVSHLALGQPKIQFLANLFQCAGIGFAMVGFHFYGLPGFIGGTAIAAALTTIYVHAIVPAQRRATAVQSLVATGLVLGYCFAAKLLLDALAGFPVAARHTVAVALAAIPCLVALINLKNWRQRGSLG